MYDLAAFLFDMNEALYARTCIGIFQKFIEIWTFITAHHKWLVALWIYFRFFLSSQLCCLSTRWTDKIMSCFRPLELHGCLSLLWRHVAFMKDWRLLKLLLYRLLYDKSIINKVFKTLLIILFIKSAIDTPSTRRKSIINKVLKTLLIILFSRVINTQKKYYQ